MVAFLQASMSLYNFPENFMKIRSLIFRNKANRLTNGHAHKAIT